MKHIDMTLVEKLVIIDVKKLVTIVVSNLHASYINNSIR